MTNGYLVRLLSLLLASGKKLQIDFNVEKESERKRLNQILICSMYYVN